MKSNLWLFQQVEVFEEMSFDRTIGKVFGKQKKTFIFHNSAFNRMPTLPNERFSLQYDVRHFRGFLNNHKDIPTVRKPIFLSLDVRILVICFRETDHFFWLISLSEHTWWDRKMYQSAKSDHQFGFMNLQNRQDHPCGICHCSFDQNRHHRCRFHLT